MKYMLFFACVFCGVGGLMYTVASLFDGDVTSASQSFLFSIVLFGISLLAMK